MALKRKEPEAESAVFGTEEALAKIAMELLNPSEQKLFTVTDVTPEEVFSIATAMRYAKLFNSKVVENWVRDFLLLRISRLRMGRREFILLSTGIKEVEERKRRGKVTDIFAGLKLVGFIPPVNLTIGWIAISIVGTIALVFLPKIFERLKLWIFHKI